MKNIKTAAILIAVLAIFFVMAVASGSKDKEEIKPPSEAEQTESAKQTESEGQGETAGELKNDVPVTVQEAVVFEQNGIRVTVKSIDTKSFWGCELKFLVENDTQSSLIVQANNISVNGYMMNSFFAADVAAGKKTNDSITFSDTDLERAGISTIADIELKFHIYDSESWETLCDSEIIKIATSASGSTQAPYDESGVKALEEDGIKVIVKGLSQEESMFGPSLIVYISNESGRNITVQARNSSINGFMIDNYFSGSVASGKKLVDAITFSSDDLEKNGIKDISNIELSFHIFDADNWDNIAETDPVSLSFD